MFYAALAVVFVSRAWFAAPIGLVDGSGDPQQSVWFLDWVPWAITHGVNPFITHHINTPGGVNLMWNALAPLLGVVLWPITATAGPVVAYDLLVTAELALSAWCAFLLIRRYVPNVWAALAGGTFYGFSPFLTAQAPSHAKVGFALLPPLLLLLLDDIVVRRRSPRRYGLLLGAALGAQLLVYEEGFVLGLVGGAVVLLVLAVRAGREETRARLGHVARAAAWALPAMVVIVAVPMAWQLFGPDRLPTLLPGGAVYVTDVANLVVPTPTQWFSPSFTQRLAANFSGNSLENASYLGVPMLLVMALALWRSRRRTLVVVTAWSTALLVLLSMGPQLHIAGHTSSLPLPWKVISVLPMFGSALPSRLFVYVDLGAAMLLAVFVDEILMTHAVRWAPRAAAAVGVALVALSVMPVRAGFAVLDVPDFFTASVGRVVPRNSTVLVAPFAHDGDTALPMVWQASAGMAFRMPEGYFVNITHDGARRDGPSPTATSKVMTAIQSGHTVVASDDVARHIRADLRRWKVTAVIVGPMAHRDGMVALFTRVFGVAPELRGGVDVWVVSAR